MSNIILENETLVLDKPINVNWVGVVTEVMYEADVEDGDEETAGSPICNKLCVYEVCLQNGGVEEVSWDLDEVPVSIYRQLLSFWSRMLADAR